MWVVSAFGLPDTRFHLARTVEIDSGRGEKRTNDPGSNDFSSLAVFVLPILSALAGIVFLDEWTGPVPAALIGFIAGVFIARGFYH